jgi:hypothetical protein
MPSNSLRLWRTARCGQLDEVESAHGSVGGTGPGRRPATLQLNYSYALLLSAHFQGFCRDLHTEAVVYVANWLTTPISSFRQVMRNWMLANRRLETGNPNPGNLGSDFNRFGLDFWKEVHALSPSNARRRERLEELNRWRNAIAHHDFSHLPHPRLRLAQVRRWRVACDRFPVAFDQVLFSYLQRETGSNPW